MKVIVKLLLLLIWVLVKVLYDLTRKVKWKLTGLYTQLQLHNQPMLSLHNKVAHVESILFRYKMDELVQPQGMENFITSHEGFVEPDYILRCPNVTLYSVNHEQAIFVETDGTDVHNMENGGSFLGFSQMKHAKKVISVPLWAFIALGKKVGKPEKEIVIISCTAACGSSLMLRVLEATKKFTIISEPDAIKVIQELKQKLPKHIINDLVMAIINLLCKPRNSDCEKYVIKLVQPGLGNLPMIIDLYPEAKQLFMYRRGLDVVKSFCRSWHIIPFTFVLKWMSYLSDDVYQTLLGSFGITTEMVPKGLYSYHHIFTLLWATSIKSYLVQRDKHEIPAVRYEDMLSDKDYAMRQVFDYLLLEYNTDLVEGCFRKDARRNTPLERGEVAKQKPRISLFLPNALESKLNDMCTQIGVPYIQENILLPGTITYRKTS